MNSNDSVATVVEPNVQSTAETAVEPEEPPLPMVDAPPDLVPLQGRWSVKSITVNGQTAKPAEVKDGQLEISGQTISRRLRIADGQMATISGTLSVDNSTTPKQWNVTEQQATENGEGLPLEPTLEAVYQLEGDTLKIASGWTDPAFGDRPFRPASLDATGSEVTVTTYQRKK